MPNTSDFSRWVDIANEKGESSINGGNLAELELNSHFIEGERLSICTLIARRNRLCRSLKPADGNVSPHRSP